MDDFLRDLPSKCSNNFSKYNVTEVRSSRPCMQKYIPTKEIGPCTPIVTDNENVLLQYLTRNWDAPVSGNTQSSYSSNLSSLNPGPSGLGCSKTASKRDSGGTSPVVPNGLGSAALAATLAAVSPGVTPVQAAEALQDGATQPKQLRLDSSSSGSARTSSHGAGNTASELSTDGAS